MEKVLRYGYEWSGYDYDDIGREYETSGYEELEAVHAFHSEHEDLWFFEKPGRESAEEYAEDFTTEGKTAELIEVPLGILLHVKNN